jgi:hypothetical protein
MNDTLIFFGGWALVFILIGTGLQIAALMVGVSVWKLNGLLGNSERLPILTQVPCFLLSAIALASGIGLILASTLIVESLLGLSSPRRLVEFLFEILTIPLIPLTLAISIPKWIIVDLWNVLLFCVSSLLLSSNCRKERNRGSGAR